MGHVNLMLFAFEPLEPLLALGVGLMNYRSIDRGHFVLVNITAQGWQTRLVSHISSPKHQRDKGHQDTNHLKQRSRIFHGRSPRILLGPSSPHAGILGLAAAAAAAAATTRTHSARAARKLRSVTAPSPPHENPLVVAISIVVVVVENSIVQQLVGLLTNPILVRAADIANVTIIAIAATANPILLVLAVAIEKAYGGESVGVHVKLVDLINVRFLLVFLLFLSIISFLLLRFR
mmetsp:Transcript_43477/g.74193  ORF Transcript_43477/g.74193 Transcript_43477/m.74193 type:complete len:234 (-) Transcript_43477:100-801(-)